MNIDKYLSFIPSLELMNVELSEVKKEVVKKVDHIIGNIINDENIKFYIEVILKCSMY